MTEIQDVLRDGFGKSIITVFCDYCQDRQPFDLIRGGQMICIKCHHNVNSVMRKSLKPEKHEIQSDILDFVH